MDETGNDSAVSPRNDRAERKLLFILISAGVIACVFGVVQIFFSIRKPFQIVKTTNTSTLGASGEALSTLTKTDTDGDGLNDYNELYVYQTSPYLTDSDSDGSTDAAEVSGGTDPNCAQGEVCTPIALTNTSDTNATNTNFSLTNIVPSASSALSADDIRQTLLNAGAPQATLESLSDAELLELYNEVTGGASVATNASVTEPVAPTSPDVESLKNLTPEQMREFLVQGGADRETLDNVDDETLKAIFEEAVNQVTQ